MTNTVEDTERSDSLAAAAATETHSSPARRIFRMRRSSPAERFSSMTGSASRLRSGASLGAVLVLSALVQSSNFAGTPGVTAAEGSVAEDVWSLLTVGSPGGRAAGFSPLGTLQIAGWVGATRGFERHDTAIAAAREPMVALTILSVMLLWLLVRRLGYSRAAASGAALIMALSPLAVALHRLAAPENVAAGWILLALLGAVTARRQLLGFSVAATASGSAVLSSGHAVLVVPLVAWLMVRASKPETRRYCLTVAASTFAIVIGGYFLVATTLGEFVGETTGPVDGVASGGAALRAAVWFSADPVLGVIAVVALTAGLIDRRLRPFAITAVLLAGTWLFPGGVVAAPPVFLLPLVAVLIVGVAEKWLRRVFSRADRRSSETPVSRPVAWSGIVVLLAGGVVAVPLWGAQLGGLLRGDSSGPVRSAEVWIAENLPKNARLLVDNSVRLDLVRRGFASKNVVSAQQLDADPLIQARSRGGWRAADYVVTTGADRMPGVGSAASARANSTVVASFGSGQGLTQVGRIDPLGRPSREKSLAEAEAVRLSSGKQLFENPGLRAFAADRFQLITGNVDERITIVIGQLLAAGPVIISGFPENAGEAGLPRRQVVVAAVNGELMVRAGQATREGENLLASMTGSFRPESVRATPAGLLITFSISTPRGLVQ